MAPWWDDDMKQICTQLCIFLDRSGQHVLRISSPAHFCFSMVKRLREAISCWRGPNYFLRSHPLVFFACHTLEIPFTMLEGHIFLCFSIFSTLRMTFVLSNTNICSRRQSSQRNERRSRKRKSQMHRMQTSRAINIAQASRNPRFSQSLGFAPIPWSDFSATQNELQTFGRICLIISVGFHLGGLGRKRNRSIGKSITGIQCTHIRSFPYILPLLVWESHRKTSFNEKFHGPAGGWTAEGLGKNNTIHFKFATFRCPWQRKAKY